MDLLLRLTRFHNQTALESRPTRFRAFPKRSARGLFPRLSSRKNEGGNASASVTAPFRPQQAPVSAAVSESCFGTSPCSSAPSEQRTASPCKGSAAGPVLPPAARPRIRRTGALSARLASTGAPAASLPSPGRSRPPGPLGNGEGRRPARTSLPTATPHPPPPPAPASASGARRDVAGRGISPAPRPCCCGGAWRPRGRPLPPGGSRRPRRDRHRDRDRHRVRPRRGQSRCPGGGRRRTPRRGRARPVERGPAAPAGA